MSLDVAQTLVPVAVGEQPKICVCVGQLRADALRLQSVPEPQSRRPLEIQPCHRSHDRHVEDAGSDQPGSLHGPHLKK